VLFIEWRTDEFYNAAKGLRNEQFAPRWVMTHVPRRRHVLRHAPQLAPCAAITPAVSIMCNHLAAAASILCWVFRRVLKCMEGKKTKNKTAAQYLLSKCCCLAWPFRSFCRGLISPKPFGTLYCTILWFRVSSASDVTRYRNSLVWFRKDF